VTNWSVAGNTLVLYVIGRHLGYRTTTNVYITTLCVADMAAAVASLLLAPMTGACVTWSVCVACVRHVIFSSSHRPITAPTGFRAISHHDLVYVCMYVCVERLCSRRPYSPDCQGGAMGMYQCALENTTVFCESAIATDHDELSVGASSNDPVRVSRDLVRHVVSLCRVRRSQTLGRHGDCNAAW